MAATAFRIARCNDAFSRVSAEECKALAHAARREMDNACTQRARIGRARLTKPARLSARAPTPARAPSAASRARVPPVNREWARLYDQAMRAFVADVATRRAKLEVPEPPGKRVTFKLSEIEDALPPPPFAPPVLKRKRSEAEAGWVTELRSCLAGESKY